MKKSVVRGFTFASVSPRVTCWWTSSDPRTNSTTQSWGTRPILDHAWRCQQAVLNSDSCAEANNGRSGPEFVLRAIDRVRVVGRSKPVVLHELVGERDTVDEDVLEWCESYAEALSVYEGRDWPAAREMFESVAQRWWTTKHRRSWPCGRRSFVKKIRASSGMGCLNLNQNDAFDRMKMATGVGGGWWSLAEFVRCIEDEKCWECFPNLFRCVDHFVALHPSPAPPWEEGFAGSRFATP